MSYSYVANFVKPRAQRAALGQLLESRCPLGTRFNDLGMIFLLAALAFTCAATSQAHDGHVVATKPRQDAPRFMTTRTSDQVLPMTDEENVFHFVIYGDRTGGVPEGLKVLEQAVVDTNLLDPDLVMTVGDLIPGYNQTDQWVPQMKRYKSIMSKLRMPWYPVAGNHDIYWRGTGPAPAGHHETNYEKHFGPLWYSFSHKNAAFIVLYSDEGDSKTNIKGFRLAPLQRMSDSQLSFLKDSLTKYRAAEHVFVFLHHPRWIMPNYQGGNWDTVHQLLKDAGNVSAVFAGHIHHMHYGGTKDGIQYYTLGTTGGSLQAEIPDAGYLHHMNMVSVRPSGISVSAFPVGGVIDPKEFTQDFLKQVAIARKIRPVSDSEAVQLNVDGSASDSQTFVLKNPSEHSVDATITLESSSRWHLKPDHVHKRIKPGQSLTFEMRLDRSAGELESMQLPQVLTSINLLGESSRIRLPDVVTPISVRLSSVPSDYFSDAINHCLNVTGPDSVARIENRNLQLPDGPMTVEAWLKPAGTMGYRGTIAKTEGSEFAIFMDEGVPQFDINLNGFYFTAKGQDVLTVDKWAHVAGVFDGQAVKIFVDGKLVGSRPAVGKRRKNRLPLLIGADVDAGGNPTRSYKGAIDEVRVSKAAVYGSNFTPSRSLKSNNETILLLQFDRRIGPFVLDRSSKATRVILGKNASLIPVN